MGLKRLILNKETLRTLTETQMLRGVAGAGGFQMDVVPPTILTTGGVSNQCTQSSNAETQCHC